MFVFNSNSAKRQFKEPATVQVRMFVNEKSIIAFCARCFNDMDSFRHAQTNYKCWVIINMTAPTESLACASDQGSYCEQ